MDKSHLSMLPAELRNFIYELVLKESEPIKIREKRRSLVSVPVWRPPALLQSCRAIRQEASCLYFALNTFEVQCHLHPDWTHLTQEEANRFLRAWLASLTLEDRKSVRKIRLNDIMHGPATAEVRADGCRAMMKGLGMDPMGVEIFLEVNASVCATHGGVYKWTCV